MSRFAAALLALPLVLAACAKDPAPTPAPADTVAVAPSPSPAPADTARAPAPDTWTVTPTSFGPLRIGMTAAQASEALGTRLTPDYMEGSTCGYAKFAHDRHDVYLMFSEGTLARFDPAATPSPITTADGFGVGTTEAQIEARYPSATKELHAYTNGQYVKVATAGGYYVFETDSTNVVTDFRAGRQPEVDYVEGCS